MAKQEPLKIPFQVASLDGVPQPLRLFFTERDGAFHLNLDGEHPDSVKLEEFRNNNRSLHTQKAELEATVTKLTNELNEIKGKAATGDEQAQKLADVAAQLEREQQAHRATRLQALVTAAFIANGGEAKAVDYAHQLAAATFQVGADGKLTTTARDAEGALLTLEVWLAQQQRERPFLFKPSRGGGAQTTSTGTPPPIPSVSRHDPLEFGRNVEAIATGRMRVAD